MSTSEPAPRLGPPSGSHAALAQGQVLLELGRYEEALAHLTRAAALSPSDHQPRCALSAVYLHLDRPQDALEAAEAAAALEPTSGWAQRLRALASIALGDKTQAKAAALESCRLEAEEPVSYVALSRALQFAGDEAGAVAAARHAVSLAPDLVDTRDQLGRILLAHDDPAGAEAEFRAALAIDANNAVVLNNLGVAQGRQRQTEEAFAGIERASRADPGYALPRENILRAGRRLAGIRRGAVLCVVIAVVLFIVDDNTNRLGAAMIPLLFAVVLEVGYRRARDKLPPIARTLIADDTRAQRFAPHRWDWSWLLRIRPWWWRFIRDASPRNGFLLNLAVVALVLTMHNPVLLGVFALGLPFSARRLWKASRRAHPGRDSWRPPGQP